jgi:hypothetical protein
MHRLRYIDMNHPFRNMWISLGVGVAVATVGMVLLRNADEARAAFMMFCIVFTISLRHFLDRSEIRGDGK